MADESEARPHRIGLAVAGLRISAVLYLLLGFGLPWLFLAGDILPDAQVHVLMPVMVCAVLAAGLEVVAKALRRRKFWAWIAGLCIFGMYLPSLFLPGAPWGCGACSPPAPAPPSGWAARGKPAAVCRRAFQAARPVAS